MKVYKNKNQHQCSGNPHIIPQDKIEYRLEFRSFHHKILIINVSHRMYHQEYDCPSNKPDERELIDEMLFLAP